MQKSLGRVLDVLENHIVTKTNVDNNLSSKLSATGIP